jgi:pyruvate/2-oxoglutarate dehydrogenase complex dihydrolipoamide acyltransferase (E2) component
MSTIGGVIIAAATVVGLFAIGNFIHWLWRQVPTTDHVRDALSPPQLSRDPARKLTPLQISWAKRNGVDLSTVAGTGEGGEITAGDLRRARKRARG